MICCVLLWFCTRPYVLGLNHFTCPTASQTSQAKPTNISGTQHFFYIDHVFSPDGGNKDTHIYIATQKHNKTGAVFSGIYCFASLISLRASLVATNRITLQWLWLLCCWLWYSCTLYGIVVFCWEIKLLLLVFEVKPRYPGAVLIHTNQLMSSWLLLMPWHQIGARASTTTMLTWVW